MRFQNPYWTTKQKIGLLQNWLIVHSLIYYEHDTSVVTDREYDTNARQLVRFQTKYPDIAKESRYWYVFHDYDGSTGFHLYSRLNKPDKERLSIIASHVMRISKR